MNYNPFSLKDKVILVTGASSGIGRATAIECSKLGATVIVTARNEERLSETLSLLEGEGHEMRICDLSDLEQIDNLVASLPVLHGLVNNAGVTQLLPIHFIKPDVLRNIVDINAVAPILLLQRLVKKKKLDKGASVVFTSSISALGAAATGNSMYAASKGMVSSFIRIAALELANKKIRVNAVCPGMVNTKMIANDIISEQEAKQIDAYPLKRYGEPVDVAWAIVYLLSNASSWVTGTNMIIDGGLTLA